MLLYGGSLGWDVCSPLLLLCDIWMIFCVNSHALVLADREDSG